MKYHKVSRDLRYREITKLQGFWPIWVNWFEVLTTKKEDGGVYITTWGHHLKVKSITLKVEVVKVDREKY